MADTFDSQLQEDSQFKSKKSQRTASKESLMRDQLRDPSCDSNSRYQDIPIKIFKNKAVVNKKVIKDEKSSQFVSREATERSPR